MVQPPKIQALPDVLTVDEIAQLICATRERRFRVFWLATYSMGLRLGETLKLEVPDIDSARMRVHVRLGKGNKDRFVILPAVTLEALRRWWAVHRHPRWLFPSQTGTQQAPALRSWIAVPPSAHSSAPPRTPGSANMCRFIPCATATPPIWWKPASCAPRARQASRGLALDLRGVQDQLGHASPTTTARYVRMTETSALQQDTAINGLVDRLTAAVRAGRGRAG